MFPTCPALCRPVGDEFGRIGPGLWGYAIGRRPYTWSNEGRALLRRAGTAHARGVRAHPKPMVTIGDRPILWHIMKYYAHFGHNDFVLCLGYKAEVIKEYFLNYNEALSNDFVLVRGRRERRAAARRDIDDWTITFVDTGPAVQHRRAAAGACGRTSRARRCSSPTTATCSPTLRCRLWSTSSERARQWSPASSACGPELHVPHRQTRTTTAS